MSELPSGAIPSAVGSLAKGVIGQLAEDAEKNIWAIYDEGKPRFEFDAVTRQAVAIEVQSAIDKAVATDPIKANLETALSAAMDILNVAGIHTFTLGRDALKAAGEEREGVKVEPRVDPVKAKLEKALKMCFKNDYWFEHDQRSIVAEALRQAEAERKAV